MRKIFALIALCLFCDAALGQEPSPDSNGLNLEKVCDYPVCLYANFESQVVYPDDSAVQWIMNNFEIALHENGQFLCTSDFFVTEPDLGAEFQIEFQLYDAKENKIGAVQTNLESFYSESGYAEPYVFSTKVSESVSRRTAFFGMKIVQSRILPYYELDGSCYLPCKKHLLHQEIKNFKKS